MEQNPQMQKQVQWYPGHMAKTRRLIAQQLPLVDAVVELVDARVAQSSRNPELDEMTGQKPRIVLLNKSDMADEAETARALQILRESAQAALAVDCRSGKGLKAFQPLVRELLREKIARNAEKGMPGKPLRLMVVGIPNTGKSSFINRMANRNAGQNRAKVADKPGVTQHNNWFAIGQGIELLDTPGVLWPKFEDPTVGLRLAFIGSIKDEILDITEIALAFLNVMLTQYPAALTERYRVEVRPDGGAYEMLEQIAKKRGMLLGGAQPDLERASVMLLDEYRAGRLGRISFD